MYKDINTMTGIEFENLCQLLLKTIGFDVETTKQSGDGGIDLIAYNHQTFFEGKYIVQCKRYSGSVGEPIIRDLYGVVTSERANKGILITTGYFTLSAIKFAEDKNIELIDGEKLYKILDDNNLMENTKPSKNSHFTQYKCFDNNNYEFYKNMINQNMLTIDMGKKFIFEFMFNYYNKCSNSKDDELYEMMHSGFSKEYLRLFDWYMNKFYKKNKIKDEIFMNYAFRKKSIALLFDFNLFEYVQNRYSILNAYLKKPCYALKYEINIEKNSFRLFHLEDWHTKYREDEKKYISDNLMKPGQVEILGLKDFNEIMNMLSIFKYFDIQIGVDYINKILYADYPELEKFT